MSYRPTRRDRSFQKGFFQNAAPRAANDPATRFVAVTRLGNAAGSPAKTERDAKLHAEGNYGSAWSELERRAGFTVQDRVGGEL